MLKKTKNKNSMAEKILKLGDFLNHPRTAEDIRKEIKDRFGHSFELQDIRVNLLYLIRREKITRKKDENVYKYKI